MWQRRKRLTCDSGLENSHLIWWVFLVGYWLWRGSVLRWSCHTFTLMLCLITSHLDLLRKGMEEGADLEWGASYIWVWFKGNRQLERLLPAFPVCGQQVLHWRGCEWPTSKFTMAYNTGFNQRNSSGVGYDSFPCFQMKELWFRRAK
jgi:hypothetical protein